MYTVSLYLIHSTKLCWYKTLVNWQINGFAHHFNIRLQILAKLVCVILECFSKTLTLKVDVLKWIYSKSISNVFSSELVVIAV